MKVHITHLREKKDAERILDQPLKVLFADAVDGLDITEERRVWQDSTMTFSFVGRVGFISLPLSGQLEVQESAVMIDVELPAVIKILVGEDKIRAGLQKEILALMRQP